MKHTNQKGYLTIILLIILGVSSIILFSYSTLIINQYSLTQRQTSVEQALQYAEAGINYYRWHLAHSPNDYTYGTGSPGPHTIPFKDPQGDIVGYYELSITPPTDGSNIVTIQSTGWTNEYPDIKRSITVQYGKPSMAQYAFLHDSNIWLGSGLEIFGPVHSNGGIRSDAINHSIITSSLDTYTCGSETGCSPSQIRPGIWGSGNDQSLWDFPQSPVDFNAISIDLATMKMASQNQGIYLGDTTSWGYQIIFNANGTFNIYNVTNTSNLRGYDTIGGCTNLYQGISNQSLIGTYQQSEVPIIFSENTLWVNGTITNPIQVVGARFPIETNNINIWINNSITYSNLDGSIQAGIIAQNDIIFARNIPNNFSIHGALLAQKGRIMRHNYNNSSCATSSFAVRENLNIYGSIISANKSYWNWGTQPVSGFRNRTINYDANLLYNPPPYFPTTGEYTFISWTE